MTTKILHIIESLRPGGAENVVATLARHSRSHGLDVEVVALATGGDVADALARDGIRVHILNKRPGLDRHLPPALARLVRDRSPDILHAHNPIAHHWTVIASFLLRRPPPIINCEHSIHYPGRIARWYPAVRTVLCLKDAAIVGVCEAVTASHMRLDPLNRTRYRTIYNGIEPVPRLTGGERDALKTELGLARGTFVVGTVGNLRPAKAHSDLLEAFAATSAVRKDTVLVVAGEGPLRAELAAQAERLGVAGRVHWLGRRGDVSRLLGVFDVFVLSSRREGFPVAVLEAASAGVPIVATDVGGVREVVRDGDTGRLVPPARPDLLAAALRDVIERPDAAIERARSARAAFEREFTAEIMTRKTEALYQEILGKPLL